MATALNLDVAPAAQEYPMGEEFPDDWQPTSAYSIELTYECDGAERIFAYKDSHFSASTFVQELASTIRSSSFTTAIAAATSTTEFRAFAPALQFGRELDLGIRENCMVILRMAEEKELYWSSDPEPIKTKDQARPDTYFGLRMIDAQGRAYKPRDFPNDRTCKQISFGARRLPDMPEPELHPFGLHLRAMTCPAGGGIEDVHIDPDIKNPIV